MKAFKRIGLKLRKELHHLSKYRVINLKRLHTLWEQQHLGRLLPHFDVDCVFDVGANYGQYAKQLRKKIGFKGLIISFEPIPEAAERLRRESKNDPLWIIEEVALSHTDGKQTFNIMSRSQFSSLSTPKHDETELFLTANSVSRSIEVKAETLASAYHRLSEKYLFKRPFLKLDTQGFDLEIVSHAADSLPNFIGLQSELAVKKLYENSIDFREAISRYEKFGFSLSAFVPNNAGYFPELIETDCIMVRTDLLPKTEATTHN